MDQSRITTSTSFAEKYRAISSRDSRFDGQFITGVHSTGIYCRPSCPATTPLERNVSFYRTAAAAHEAGLRACKRCLPDAVPGSPDWNSTDDLAARAMRLIEDGVVEREGVPGLASRLGYTTRHLTRVLVAELGAGPLALARAHRSHNARLLLVNTSLSISDVAFASGFASVRQFNETMQAVFALTPTAIRSTATLRSTAHATTPGAITLRLPARAPFDGAGIMTYLADHAVPHLESFDGTTFSRAITLPHGVARLSLSLSGGDAVSCTAKLDNLADVATLVSRVRRLFDLDADSLAIDTALALDPQLAPLVAATPGIRIPGALDPHEALFRTLLGQQVSIAGARTVCGRLTEALGTSVDDGDSRLFPTARQFAEAGENALSGPRARIRGILGVAEALASGDLTLDLGSPVDEFRSQLTALPGIGEWTAGYVAMRVLGSPDILLSTDLVVLHAARDLGLPTTASALAAHGERWAPWRSYAGLHLWRSRAIHKSLAG